MKKELREPCVRRLFPVPARAALACLAVSWLGGQASAAAANCHVWEKIEITLLAEGDYSNAYTDVDVWVDLKGSGFEKRCYGFWDGGRTFRVRVMATAPGAWTWRSGSRPADRGLDGISGSFTATAWTDPQKDENPCRRGMLRASANGHAFEYADGTPFFLLGDTWWATSTSRFRWHDDDQPRPLGPEAGFKDYVRYRRRQQYNCIAIIAAFPNWANDGRPATLKMDDGTILRSAWRQAGTDSAKDMTDEAGNRPFLFPGRVPGHEEHFPDLERINPAYFQAFDRKIDHLNAHGMVPFIEVARRDIGQAWRKYYPWPASYSRYIQYVWSRYQANICLFSPIHFDTPAQSIPTEDWNAAAHGVLDKYGPPPFGTPAGTNSNPSSLVNWGHVDKARWLSFHQIGNRRTHDVYAHLTEIYRASPPVPGINGEPYYDGMENIEGGTEASALYCRSAMYGSVLSGGLGGHIYGAGGWDGGLWSGEVEPASKYPIWQVIQWPSGDQMRHLKSFILSEDRRYQELVPSTELLAPNRSGKPNTCTGWAYCAVTPAKDLFLLYFEKDCPRATLSGALARKQYRARWFNPRTGEWVEAGPVSADAEGIITLPQFPGDQPRAGNDWGMKLQAGTPPAAGPPANPTLAPAALPPKTTAPADVPAGPIKTEIRKEDGRFRLYRGGQPYKIKGVVYVGDRGGQFPLKDVAAHGANSIRSGGGQPVLDEAYRLDLSVLVNLGMRMEKVHNFDYSDEKAVREQFEKIKARILLVKDHPAVLMYAIGNELSVFEYTNKRVWNAVNDVARFIHQVDPNHPCLTVIGDGSLNRGDLVDIRRLAPDLDLLGINYYMHVETVPDKIRQYEWDKPYVLTEWGPSGDWQVPRTEWNAAIEDTSTEKARLYLERYQNVVLKDSERCLGSYAFIWGARHERTQTWFGMHLPTGERTEAVNAMQFAWTGKWPANRAPRIEDLRIDGRTAMGNVYLKPGTVQKAVVRSVDPESDPLAIRWEILAEVSRIAGSYAGMGEKPSTPRSELIEKAEGPELTFRAPAGAGAYRLFVFITDGHGNGATANLPFHVRP